jgi:betaine-aldehyde dehydrogenase
MTNTQYPLPTCRDLFYGGQWHVPMGGYSRTCAPATQDDLGPVAEANAADVGAAVRAAHEAFPAWRSTPPAERAALLRRLAERVRACADEFAYLDALNCGNPIREMARDALAAAAQMDYYAGLVRELKGETLPVGDGAINYSVREPLGVVVRIVAYNHPLMFLAGKLAPALAAGNTVILKPPVQAPLSAYRLAQLVEEVMPPGVVSILSGDRECGEALVKHPLVRKVALIGSTTTGVAILKGAADKIMPVQLELGGKNPLIICPDADLDRAIEGAVNGMNFTWAGQSCGSTSRCFVHRSIYDKVIEGIRQRVIECHRCGLPTEPGTTMGCLISKAQFDKTMGFIESAHAQGARLVCGGGRPADPALAKGWFVEATVFADVTPSMRLFQEEVFGPVLAVIPWESEDELLKQVNALEYGLTASIWTRDLVRAHRLASRVESGYVWINHASSHVLGAEFGGYKRSGIGREEGLSELLAWTQTKNVYVSLG